jgi:hypothetical protein
MMSYNAPLMDPAASARTKHLSLQYQATSSPEDDDVSTLHTSVRRRRVTRWAAALMQPVVPTCEVLRMYTYSTSIPSSTGALTLRIKISPAEATDVRMPTRTRTGLVALDLGFSGSSNLKSDAHAVAASKY